jgi:3-oxoacyl-[acyl-carrier protein] reductase
VNLNGKVAIITGSGRGIGKGIALVLARHGADIVITDIDSRSAQETSQEIAALGRKSIAVESDVSKIDDVKRIVDDTINKLGRIDILVNNAGVTRDALVDKMSEADWDTVLNINLKSFFLMTQAVMPEMRKNKFGRVINISSKAAWVGNMGQANYTAAKAGALALTLTVAKEFGRYVKKEECDLTCNAIMPGFIDTPMTQAVPENVRQIMLSQVPLNRAGTPEDIGNAVVFLSSEYGSYLNGAVIPVDGGFWMAL